MSLTWARVEFFDTHARRIEWDGPEVLISLQIPKHIYVFDLNFQMTAAASQQLWPSDKVPSPPSTGSKYPVRESLTSIERAYAKSISKRMNLAILEAQGNR